MNKNLSGFLPDTDYHYFSYAEEIPFIPDAEDFTLNNALWLAEASMLAYTGDNTISSVCKEFFPGGYTIFQTALAKCFILEKENYVILSFRGTEIQGPQIIPDLFTDFDTRLAEFSSGGKVHKGFLHAFTDIWEKDAGLRDSISLLKQSSPKKYLWITGHSLGAALALLTFIHEPAFQGCYTFGSPKAGTKKLYSHLTGNVFRFVNVNDIVCRIPPSIPAGEESDDEFVHFGNVKYLDKNGSLKDKIPKKYRKFSKTITALSGFFDTLADKDTIFSEKIINIIENKTKTRDLKKTGFSRHLEAVEKTINDYGEFSIPDHSPLEYVNKIANLCKGKKQ